MPFSRIPAAIRRLLAALACLAAATSAHAGPRTGNGLPSTVILSPGDIWHLGIQTAAAQKTSYAPQVHGYGVVLDFSALAQADADISTARAAARQSSADLKRTQALFRADRAVSQQVLEVAERQAATDQAQAALAERKEAAQFGQGAPWRGSVRDGALLSRLAGGKSVLVEVTFPLGVILGAQPPELSVTHLNPQIEGTGWKTAKIWNAPADPTIPGRSFFALVDGSDLESGEHVLIFSPTGPSVEGERIPAEAVIFSRNKTWCYLQVAPNAFQRLPVDISRPVASGYFLSNAAIGDRRVVIKGTGLLLARELGAAEPPRQNR
ncbi:MAG TPA: hypothetical protein VHW02_14395 [Rhizomicrobium sp.]|jgi:hypothetical protein|nr:hypothetical protein [Rhizomicrobium sp.]